MALRKLSVKRRYYSGWLRAGKVRHVCDVIKLPRIYTIAHNAPQVELIFAVGTKQNFTLFHLPIYFVVLDIYRVLIFTYSFTRMTSAFTSSNIKQYF